MNFMGLGMMGMMNPFAMLQMGMMAGMQASQMMMGGGNPMMQSPMFGDQGCFSPQAYQQMQMMQMELQMMEMGLMMGMQMGRMGYGGMPGYGGGMPGFGGGMPGYGFPGGFPGGCHWGGGGCARPCGPMSGPPPSTRPSGNVENWIQQAKSIMAQQGINVSNISDSDLATIIQHESGGNPNAINNWDSNARAGHPSKGLMQTIDSTFNQYALPGHGNIYNPVDNIIAGTRYAIARYGSISNVPGVRAVHQGRAYVGY